MSGGDDLSRYRAPFTLHSKEEGDIYLKYREHDVSRPLCLDWDLIDDLHLRSKVERYLNVLGLRFLAQEVDYSGFDELCIEFLTTLSIYGTKENVQFKFRMKNVSYVVTLDQFSKVLGFKAKGERMKPRAFNVNEEWEALTGFANWDSKGMPAGFIKDHALSIVHKYLSYTVSGKKEGNKVNSNEVYLLSCAKKGVDVCMGYFIVSCMINNRTRGAHASWGSIITALAKDLGVIDATSGLMEGYEELEPVYINFEELKRAQLISDRHTVFPPAKRQCVEVYVNKEIVARRRPLPDTEVGPSTAMDEDDMDEDTAEQPRPDSSSLDYAQFKNHFDVSMASLKTHIDTSFTSLQTHLDTQFQTFRSEVNEKFAAQDNEMAALQAQWIDFGFPPPPP